MRLRKSLHAYGLDLVAVVDAEKVDRAWAGEPRRLRVRLYRRRWKVFPWKVWDEEFQQPPTTRTGAVREAVRHYRRMLLSQERERKRDQVDQETFTGWTGIIED
jgi:hypothetical protein